MYKTRDKEEEKWEIKERKNGEVGGEREKSITRNVHKGEGKRDGKAISVKEQGSVTRELRESIYKSVKMERWRSRYSLITKKRRAK